MSERFGWQAGEATVFDSQCDVCAHRRAGKTCDAFPDGIPEEVFSNERDHRMPYPGDGGIRFEARK